MNWNTAAFSAFPYPISAKGSAWQDNPELGPQAGKEFSKLFLQIFEKHKAPEREVRQCIAKWPDNADFKFLLAECVARRDAGEGSRILESMVADHPHALFSMAMQLRWCMTKDAPAPDFAGDFLIPELSELFPDRISFHAFEVYLFEHAVFAANVKLRRSHLDIARRDRYISLLQGEIKFAIFASDPIVAHHPGMEDDGDEYDEYDEYDADEDDDWENDEDDDENEEENLEVLETALELARKAHLQQKLKAVQTEEPPHYTLAATEALFAAPIMLPADQIETLLAQDRATLIADLELVLHDAVVRYQYYVDRENENYASLHALILLCYFRAASSIPAIIDFLSQPEEVLDWWLSDILGQNVGNWLVQILEGNLGAMDALILDPHAFVYARHTPLTALEQIASHWPERKEEVEDHLIGLLEKLIQLGGKEEDKSNLYGYIAHIVVGPKMPRLFAAMKPLYVNNEVDLEFTGDWKMTQSELAKPFNPEERYPLQLGDLPTIYKLGLAWTEWP